MISLIRKKFSGHECSIACTVYPGHARRLAKQTIDYRYDAIVAVGGDGTVHEVVNGVRGSNMPIGIVPAGSANDLALRLGIPVSFADACNIILSRTTRRIDVMMANGRYFLTTCGIGFPAEVITAVRKSFDRTIMLRLIGRNRRHRIYIAGVVIAVLKKLPYIPVRICCDGQWHAMSTTSLIIGLQSNLGKYFTPLPHADPDGAVMAAYSINTGDRLRLLRHIWRTTKGTQQGLTETQFMRARRIILELPMAMPFFGDGELLAAGNRFEIDCLPEAIPFFVPPAGRDRP